MAVRPGFTGAQLDRVEEVEEPHDEHEGVDFGGMSFLDESSSSAEPGGDRENAEEAAMVAQEEPRPIYHRPRLEEPNLSRVDVGVVSLCVHTCAGDVFLNDRSAESQYHPKGAQIQ